jgi:hypothetical protein
MSYPNKILKYKFTMNHGRRIVVPFKRCLIPAEYESFDILLSPRTPKPEWLQRFERITNYEPQRVLAYLDAFRDANSEGDGGNDLATAILKGERDREKIERLNFELAWRGIDIQELIAELGELT